MTIQTDNINPMLRVLVDPFIQRLSQREEVIGVAMLGGLGKRDFSDEFSDIDLSVLLEDTKKERFPLPFEFHYTYGDYVAEFNVNVLVFGQEMDIPWEHGKIEAYQNARIVYDPQGKFQSLLDRKVVFDEAEAFDRLAWIVQQYRWRAQIHSLRTLRRGYPEGAQYVLNVCLEMLVEGVFLLNKQYMPHCKWVFARLHALNHFGLYDKFKECLTVTGFSPAEIRGRLSRMDEIFETLLQEIQHEYPDFPEDPYGYFLKKHKSLHEENPIESICLADPAYRALPEGEKRRVFGEMCFGIWDSPEQAGEHLRPLLGQRPS